MRIRKRFLSLYGSDTGPSSSDLYGGNHNNHQQPPPWVQYQQLHPNGNQTHYPLPQPSSDHTTQIGLQPDRRVSSVAAAATSNGDRYKSKIFKELECEKNKESIETECRKESILCAEVKNHDLVTKGWLQGDRLVPTKKKRGSYGRKVTNYVVQDNEMIEKTMSLKDTKTNDDKRVVMNSKKNNNKIKEKREGAILMEGSRCSRVNGRGWRCSQQTLVGYSLCEHHLGKGRVRSMTSSVRAQTISRGKDKKVISPSPSIDHDEIDLHDGEDNDDEDEFKDWDVEAMSSMEGTKVFSKKTKVGVVKARSLSSLLSQISN